MENPKIETYVTGIRINQYYTCAITTAMSWYDDKARRQFWVISHFLPRGTQPKMNLCLGPPCSLHKRRHVEHIVVWQKDKIVSVIQSFNVMDLPLTELP